MLVLQRKFRLDPTMILILMTILAGLLAVLTPWASLMAWFAAIVIAFYKLFRERLPLWVVLATSAMFGYMVFSYGFANWALHFKGLGILFPIGHFLSFLALGILIYYRRSDLRNVIREPVFWGWCALLALTAIHLTGDVARHGMYAIRDASLVLEGVFLWLGYLWVRNRRDLDLFLKILFMVFLGAYAYLLLWPIRSGLLEWSPKSGLFQEVPVLGFYSAWVPIAGSVFFAIVGRHILRWPYWVFIVLGAVYAGWAGVFQYKAIYLGILIMVIFSFLSGGMIRGCLTSLVFIGGFILFPVLVNGLSQKPLIGDRSVPVTAGFVISDYKNMAVMFMRMLGRKSEPTPPTVEELIKTWSGKEPTSLTSQDIVQISSQYRFALWRETIQQWKSSLHSILFGVGFGQALTSHWINERVVVRQPHNTHLTVLARLGLAGFLTWVLIYALIFYRCIRTIRYASEAFWRDVTLWFLLAYIAGFVYTTFQPWLEFSDGAIPFFTVLGVTLRISSHRRSSDVKGHEG